MSIENASQIQELSSVYHYGAGIGRLLRTVRETVPDRNVVQEPPPERRLGPVEHPPNEMDGERCDEGGPVHRTIVSKNPLTGSRRVDIVVISPVQAQRRWGTSSVKAGSLNLPSPWRP